MYHKEVYSYQQTIAILKISIGSLSIIYIIFIVFSDNLDNRYLILFYFILFNRGEDSTDVTLNALSIAGYLPFTLSSYVPSKARLDINFGYVLSLFNVYFYSVFIFLFFYLFIFLFFFSCFIFFNFFILVFFLLWCTESTMESNSAIIS